MQGIQFDIIHAHDWLVFYAAKEAKNELHLPLLATIHATEYGRNQGKLDTPVHQRIHALENKLADEADQLVVCSVYMQQEVIRLFHVPIDKTTHIPNGVIPFAQLLFPLRMLIRFYLMLFAAVMNRIELLLSSGGLFMKRACISS